MLDRSDRLRPQVVDTRRGPEQLTRYLETLARVELTDGLSLAGLVGETASRMPRDATVLAILPAAPAETAIALGNLRRQGREVTAILIAYDGEFSEAAGRLLAEDVPSANSGIATPCRRCPGNFVG